MAFLIVFMQLIVSYLSKNNHTYNQDRFKDNLTEYRF